ncbi:MAG: sigma-70 family RNA polymerase sigma factor [Mitsuaria chitosanitabida]|uniref:sigma-70 family RNA polymerase sigma factor n=1 Tax=Roseateles chitosanitabidus TaxID=65048 RepID=UPI001B26099C|nr:sigma-70 family RNA polymerase sigma factor [Roseateles chitosanitabidus]MBO9687504.1 sigma-70 family RNA polymerase sigma factor [Roseateles chitosanitabidus]
MSADLTLQRHVGSLYREHHGWLQSWLRQRLGCANEAADLAHDTFERLLARRETATWAEPKAYLATIARGLVIDLYRRRDVERAFLDALAAIPEHHHPSPERRAELLQTLQAVDAMLDGLPAAVREAFLLSQLEGQSYREIAERLRVTERTVANYMARAMGHCLALVA